LTRGGFFPQIDRVSDRPRLPSILPLRPLLLLVAACLLPSRGLAEDGKDVPAKMSEEEARAKKPSPAIIAEARRRFGRGNRLYKLGNYSEALLAYQAALDLYVEPVILFNMAQTFEKLRDPARAALYFERYIEVRPKAGDRDEVQARIESLKKEARVSVDISSYPPGAAIYLENKADGVKGRTPFVLQLPLGPQTILLELSGFVSETRRIDVRLGQKNFVDVQLRRQSSIQVDADVPGAKASVVDGGPKVWLRLPHVFEVQAGHHAIEIELAGHYGIRREVDVENGAQVSLLVNLKALPDYGHIQVEAVPGAIVILGDRTVAHVPMRPVKIPAGNYAISVRREGFRTWEGKITINPNRLSVARVSLNPLRSTAAKVALFSTLGTTAATLITGVVFGVLALRTQREYDSVASKALAADGKRQALIADGFFAGTGAAALATVITYFTTERGPSTADLSVVTGAPAPEPVQ
jgi:hypothetical protein